MAQAVPALTTSRRSLLVGAIASVPVAVMPVYAADLVSIRDPALEARLSAACAAVTEAVNAVTEASAKFREWTASHPEPAHRQGDEDGASAIGHPAWLQARIAAMREFGLARTKIAVYAAEALHDDACSAVASLEAKALPDLIYKARLAEWDNGRDWIANSIVDDLLALDNAT